MFFHLPEYLCRFTLIARVPPYSVATYVIMHHSVNDNCPKLLNQLQCYKILGFSSHERISRAYTEWQSTYKQHGEIQKFGCQDKLRWHGAGQPSQNGERTSTCRAAERRNEREVRQR